MIFKNIEFHNVDELTQNADGSYAMHRTPVSVEEKLSEHNGSQMNRNNVGIELRFVMKSDTVKLRFKCSEESNIVPVTIFAGDLYQSQNNYITREVSEIVIDRKMLDPTNHNADAYKRFDPLFDLSVVRVLLQRGYVDFIDVEGDVEPPTADLLPAKKIFAYGSSITSAAGAYTIESGYCPLTAHALGYDIILKGYPGACCLQKEMAEYIAKQDFDFAILELGVNILCVGVEEFGIRLTRLLKIVSEAHPDKKLFLISPFFMWDDYGVEKPSVLFRREFTRVLNELKLPNAIYIDGMTLFGNPRYLQTDTVHPDPRGHYAIAERLTKIIKDYI